MNKVVRNPTAEEIELMKNRDNAVVTPLTVVESKNNDEWRIINGARVKNKKSRFEPEPISFKLVSRGITLKGDSSLGDDNEIYVRRLGTDEEALISRIKDIDSFNAIANQIFENCILSDIKINDIALIDKMHLFAFVNAISFSEKISLGNVTAESCPVCKKEKKKPEVTASILKDMSVTYVPKTFTSPYKFEIKSFPGYKIELQLSYPTIENEELFFEDSIESIAALKSLIVSWKGTDDNGNELKEDELDEVIRWMGADDKEAFTNNLTKFSDYGSTFSFSKFNCSKGASCGMKGKKIDLTIIDLMSAIVQAIFTKK